MELFILVTHFLSAKLMKKMPMQTTTALYFTNKDINDIKFATMNKIK